MKRENCNWRIYEYTPVLVRWFGSGLVWSEWNCSLRMERTTMTGDAGVGSRQDDGKPTKEKNGNQFNPVDMKNRWANILPVGFLCCVAMKIFLQFSFNLPPSNNNKAVAEKENYENVRIHVYWIYGGKLKLSERDEYSMRLSLSRHPIRQSGFVIFILQHSRPVRGDFTFSSEINLK